MYALPISLGLIAFILVRVLYKAFRLELGERDPNSYVKNPIMYMTVNDFINDSRRPLLAFISFRSLPVAAVFTLSLGVLAGHSHQLEIESWILTISFLAPYLIVRSCELCSSPQRKRIQATYILIEILIVLIVLSCKRISSAVDLSYWFPNGPTLISGVATAFFTFLVYSAYRSLTEPASNHDAFHEDDEYATSYIEQELSNLKRKLPSKAISAIYTKSYEYDVPAELIEAIVINENLNRPKSWRLFENLLVLIPGFKATVGIAQMTSSRPLTDAQSIELLARDIHSSGLNHKSTLPEIDRYLQKRNPDPDSNDLVIRFYVSLKGVEIPEKSHHSSLKTFLRSNRLIQFLMRKFNLNCR
ncbi:MAG: hypothetical protein GX483_00655 [Actinomycetaceae bacterium]|nr:hypothetical protein [Actinomycetaceae bacterium]